MTPLVPPPKRITTNEVRYPGASIPEGLVPEVASPESTGKLRPVRDTGISVTESSRQRQRNRRKQLAKQRGVAVAVIAAFLVLVGMASVSVYRSAVAEGLGRARLATRTATARAKPRPVTAEAPHLAPTPSAVFASYRGVELHVPVPTSALTELLFHQASFTYARRLQTFMRDGNLAKAANKKGTGRSAENRVDSEGKLTGYALRTWRSGRPGKPDTAVDVGALAGTPVLSPVDGVVLKVKPYKLYGTYPDVQVHIAPDGMSDIDLVLIHVDRPAVKAGDRVIAGVTQVASVRRLSNLMGGLDLANYTAGPGDHTHMQLNNLKDPTYKGLQDEPQ